MIFLMLLSLSVSHFGSRNRAPAFTGALPCQLDGATLEAFQVAWASDAKYARRTACKNLSDYQIRIFKEDSLIAVEIYPRNDVPQKYFNDIWKFGIWLIEFIDPKTKKIVKTVKDDY